VAGKAGTAAWLKRTQVHGAIANGWTDMVKFLLECPAIRADANGVDRPSGYRALHFAVVWGRPGIAVLLLSHGADPNLRAVCRGGAELTPLDMARRRQGRLERPKLDGHDGIEAMREEGRELVGLFAGVEKRGYAQWALSELRNRYVQRHSPKLISRALRAELGLLRELVQRGRAEVMALEEVARRERAAAERKAALEREAAGPPRTLEEAMAEAGLLKRNPRVMMRQMSKFLEVGSLADLAKVGREDIAELDELDPAERRNLWHFITQHQPSDTLAMATAGKAGKDGEKKKKKKEKKKGGDDLSALLAEGAAGSKPKAKKAGAANPGKAAAAEAQVGSSTAKVPGKGPAANKAARGKGSDLPGYSRHWPDDCNTLTFMFRPDLPTDAFAVIAKYLYN